MQKYTFVPDKVFDAFVDFVEETLGFTLEWVPHLQSYVWPAQPDDHPDDGFALNGCNVDNVPNFEVEWGDWWLSMAGRDLVKIDTVTDEKTYCRLLLGRAGDRWIFGESFMNGYDIVFDWATTDMVWSVNQCHPRDYGAIPFKRTPY